MELLTVVIPNYNGRKYLDDCLKSLRKQTFQEFKVIIVDDGSTDGSQEYIKNRYPSVKLIELSENTGFANAANVGIKAADSEYVFLLNNDTMCDEKALESLVSVMENKKRLFSAQAKMLKMERPHDIDDCGDLYCALGWAFSPGKDKDNRQFVKRESMTSACAGAAIYRKEYFDKVGYFDEEHFCYLEDVDLGYRARLHGFANVMEPTAIVYHVGSGSSGSRYNDFKVELTAGNNIYLIYKNMPAFQIFINFPLILLGIIIKHVFYVKHHLGKAHIRGLMKGFEKIAKNADKRVKFGKTEFINAIRLQIELWVNLARRALSI
ncbi:glycosyltransferase family 2 protein [Butyrivibrio sp. AE2032]|uniref:glycosyltransferase family 2 protein n=1 Tax=Butyrivibrio sp. AE2032 TaxID=1458463 RepID=UPI00055142DD|nr:glycosyltransferase family 2 protein [Butyrivibrio sp. AE2032]